MSIRLPLPDPHNLRLRVEEAAIVHDLQLRWSDGQHELYRRLLTKLVKTVYYDLAKPHQDLDNGGGRGARGLFVDARRVIRLRGEIIVADVTSTARRIVVTVVHTSIGGGDFDPDFDADEIAFGDKHAHCEYRLTRDGRTWSLAHVTGQQIFKRRPRRRRPLQRLNDNVPAIGVFRIAGRHRRYAAPRWRRDPELWLGHGIAGLEHPRSKSLAHTDRAVLTIAVIHSRSNTNRQIIDNNDYSVRSRRKHQRSVRAWIHAPLNKALLCGRAPRIIVSSLIGRQMKPRIRLKFTSAAILDCVLPRNANRDQPSASPFIHVDAHITKDWADFHMSALRPTSAFLSIKFGTDLKELLRPAAYSVHFIRASMLDAIEATLSIQHSTFIQLGVSDRFDATSLVPTPVDYDDAPFWPFASAPPISHGRIGPWPSGPLH